MLVVNAANAAKAYSWIVEQAKTVGEAAIVDSRARYALLAVQGPVALDTVQPLTGADLGSLRPYAFTYGEVAQARALISRTGYTGEDGFEIYVPPNMADRVWQAVLQAGSAAGVVPCGLGARDTLRLEAAMRLYGNDIDDRTTPLEAGLGMFVGWNKRSFLGADRLPDRQAVIQHRAAAEVDLRGRHDRHAYSVSEAGRGDGLRAAAAGGSRYDSGRGHPRARLRGGRRRLAVLQTHASELTLCRIRPI
jgi:aminomethyltransferase